MSLNDVVVRLIALIFDLGSAEMVRRMNVILDEYEKSSSADPH